MSSETPETTNQTKSEPIKKSTKSQKKSIKSTKSTKSTKPSKKSSIKSHRKSKKSEILINWNSGGNLINSVNIGEYLRYGSTASSLGESSTKILVPQDGILTKLLVKLDTNTDNNPAPGEGNIRVFTVRRNGVNTDLKITLTGDEIQGELLAKIPVKKFDLISLNHQVIAGTPNNAIGIASLILSK